MSKDGHHSPAPHNTAKKPATYSEWKQAIQKEWDDRLQALGNVEEKEKTWYRAYQALGQEFLELYRQSPEAYKALQSVKLDPQDLVYAPPQISDAFLLDMGNFPEAQASYDRLLQKRERIEKERTAPGNANLDIATIRAERTATLKYLSCLEKGQPVPPELQNNPCLHEDIREGRMPSRSYQEWKQHLQAEWERELGRYVGMEEKAAAVSKNMQNLRTWIDQNYYQSPEIAEKLDTLIHLSKKPEGETEEAKRKREASYIERRGRIKQDIEKIFNKPENHALKEKNNMLVQQYQELKQEYANISENMELKQNAFDERNTTLRYLSWLESPAPRQPMAEKPSYDLLHPDVQNWNFPRPELTYPAWKEAIQEHWDIQLSRFDDVTEREKELEDRQRLLAREEKALYSQTPGIREKQQNRQALCNRYNEASQEDRDEIAKDIEAVDNEINSSITAFINADPGANKTYWDIQARKQSLEREVKAFNHQHGASITMRDHITTEKRETLALLSLLETGASIEVVTQKEGVNAPRKNVPHLNLRHPDIVTVRPTQIKGVSQEEVRRWHSSPDIFSEHPKGERMRKLHFRDDVIKKEGPLLPLSDMAYFKWEKTQELSDFSQKFSSQATYKQGSEDPKTIYIDDWTIDGKLSWREHISLERNKTDRELATQKAPEEKEWILKTAKKEPSSGPSSSSPSF